MTKRSRQFYPTSFRNFWERTNKSGGKKSCRDEWVKAVIEVSEEQEIEVEEAIDYLQERLELFMSSPMGQSEYCPHPENWLKKGWYDGDDATWWGREQGTVVGPVQQELRRIFDEGPGPGLRGIG